MHVISDSIINNKAVLDGFTITGGYITGTTGNVAGAGMYNISASPVIANCIFSGNSTSSGSGGGMYNTFHSTPVITNCTFSGNYASQGGGMYNYFSSTPVISNCTFSGNAAGSGGGMFNNQNSNPVIINCITWNNKDNTGTGTGSSSIVNNNSSPTITYSLVQGQKLTGTGDLDGTNAANDPLFITRANPSTAPNNTGNLHLQCFSSAIDKGNNAANTLATDLGDSARIVNGTIDLGAYENQGGCCPPGNVVYVDASKVSATMHDGFSWTTAYTSLQDALALAGNCANVTQIWIAKGTYYPDEGSGQTDDNVNSTFQLKNKLAVYGGFNGTETTLANRNFTVNVTILNGDINKDQMLNNGNALHVITGSGTDSTAVLDGFVVTGGNAADLNFGGGMVNISGSPTVKNCIFSGNKTGLAGGGMLNQYSSPTIINCIFSGNSSSFDGGGMYNDEASPTITNCIFSGNLAGEYGGGMANTIDASPVITNCTFSGNYSSDGGGGVYNEYNANPVITNCIIWNNRTGASDSSSANFIEAVAPKITYSLVQGQTPLGTGNLDGVSNANDSNYPLFVTPVDPATVPTTSGDLHLKYFSPAIDSGYNKADTLNTDLDGKRRIVNGTIDLGAYESQGCIKPALTVTNITANTTLNNCNASVAFGSNNVTATGIPAPTLVYKIGSTTISSPYTFSIGKTTVKVTATNTCGSVSKNFTVTVKDKQKPMVTCKPGASKTVSGTTYTISGTEFDAMATDNCKIPALIYSLSGATIKAFNAANISLAGVKLNVGSTTITWKATDSSNNSATCTTTVTFTQSSGLIAGTAGTGSALKTAGDSNTPLQVFASPNPTSSQFTLQLQSGSNAKCRIIIADILGRKIEEITGVAPNCTVRIGRAYYPGVYVAAIMQGDDRVTLKLVKENK